MDKATMQQQLKEHGFEQREYLGNSTYRLNFLSNVTGASYPLDVKIEPTEKGGLFVHFEEDYLEENDNVSLQVRSEALERLQKINLLPAPHSLQKKRKWLDGTEFRRDEKARQGNE